MAQQVDSLEDLGVTDETAGRTGEKRMQQYYVYLMASFSRVLYAGVTNDLGRRVHQHKAKANPDSFAARYNVTRLVHVEVFGDIRDAIADAVAREKQIKRWRRSKKVALIESSNPEWKDLSLVFE